MSPIQEVTPDGWLTNDPRGFRLLTEHLPQGQWSCWSQICEDSGSALVFWLWLRIFAYVVAGVCLIVAAYLTRTWILLVGGYLLYRGLSFLLFWIKCLKRVVHKIRHDPVAMAVVGELVPHPIVPQILSIGQAMRQSGESVDIATSEPLTSAIGRAGTHCMVWFLDNPDAQYQHVFAFRPVDNDPD